MKKSKRAKTLVLEQLAKNPILQIACEKLGISRVTLYRWRAEDKEFGKAIDDALLDGRLLVNDLAESQLVTAVKNSDIRAITYWLKHNHPSYKTRVEIEGSVNTIQELSAEQRELVEKALKLANLTLSDHGEPEPGT